MVGKCKQLLAIENKRGSESEKIKEGTIATMQNKTIRCSIYVSGGSIGFLGLAILHI
jgi:hypothetical protein